MKMSMSAAEHTLKKILSKLMNWNKNSSAEWQKEKKITTIVLIKRIYRVQYSHSLMLSLLQSNISPCFSQFPHLNTEHDVTWYQISHLIG